MLNLDARLHKSLLFLAVSVFISGTAWTAHGQSAKSTVGAQNWVVTWSTSPTTASSLGGVPTEPRFAGMTIRQVVPATIGGSAVRLRLSNLFGKAPVVLDEVFVGLAEKGAAVVSGSNKAVTFGRRAAITLPEGAEVMSDAIALDFSPLRDLAVSFHVRA